MENNFWTPGLTHKIGDHTWNTASASAPAVKPQTTEKPVETKKYKINFKKTAICPVCNAEFLKAGNRIFCSEDCCSKARKMGMNFTHRKRRTYAQIAADAAQIATEQSAVREKELQNQIELLKMQLEAKNNPVQKEEIEKFEAAPLPEGSPVKKLQELNFEIGNDSVSFVIGGVKLNFKVLP